MAGAFTKKLENMLAVSEQAMTIMKGVQQKLDENAANAQKLITLHKQYKPRLQKYMDEYFGLFEKMGRALAEASVYEDDLAAAKKAKDKSKAKTLEGKMKSLEKTANGHKKAFATASKNFNDEVALVMKAAVPPHQL